MVTGNVVPCDAERIRIVIACPVDMVAETLAGSHVEAFITMSALLTYRRLLLAVILTV